MPSVFPWTKATEIPEATASREQRAKKRSSTATLKTTRKEKQKRLMSEQDLPFAAEEIVELPEDFV